MTKPSAAIVACCSDAVQPGLTGSLPRFHGADSRRPTAFVALLLACALLSAGFVSHGHDEGQHSGGDDHHCVICCLRHHSPVTTTTAPAPSAPDLAAHATTSSRRRSGCDATLATQATRGPPA